MADVAHVIPDGGRLDARLEGPLRHLEQAGHLRRHLADGHRGGGIHVEPVQQDTAIDAQRVTLDQHAPRRRNAVHDLVVDGRAQRRREPVESLEGGLGPLTTANEVLRQPIQRRRADARRGLRPDQPEGVCEDAARRDHRLDFACRLDRDHTPSAPATRPAISSMPPTPSIAITTPRSR